MRSLSVTRLLLALVACLAAAAPLAAADAKPLNLSNTEWPPYFVGNSGFVREILDSCIPKVGYTPRFSQVKVEQVFPALQSGVIDGHVMSHSSDREKYIEFGREPLFHDGYRPVVRSGSNLKVDKLQDLDRIRLGHLVGLRYSDAYLEYVRDRKNAGNLIEAQSNEEILQMLLDGRIDAFVSLISSTRWLAAQRNAAAKIQILPLDIKTSDYFLAISRGSKKVPNRRALLDAFDACVAGLKKDGTHARLLQKYHLE